MKKGISKILTIALAAALLCANAFALEPDDIVGEWYFNVLEQNGMTLNPASMGLGMTLILNEDKTALMLNDSENEGDVDDWSIDGDTLVIGEDEYALYAELVDGTLVIDMGEDGIMVFGRELIVEQTHADFPAVAAAGISEFDGVWTGDLAEMFGMRFPMESDVVGREMRLSIANGEITLYEAMMGVDPKETVINGVFEDGTIVIEYEIYGGVETTVLSLREDGSLSFTIGEDGTIYYFAKAD